MKSSIRPTRQVADEAMYRASNSQVGAAPIDGVIFRPGGVAGGNVYTTWAGAFAAAVASNCTTTIVVDSSITPAVVPPGTYDGEGVLLLAGHGLTAGGISNFLTISDGATLKDFGGFSTNMNGLLDIRCECRTTQAFSLTDSEEFLMGESCTIQLEVGALVPALIIGATGATQSNTFRCFGPAAIDNTNAPTVPVIEVTNGWTGDFILNSYFSSELFLVTGNEIGGPVGSTVNFFRDNTVPAMSSALFFGTYGDFLSCNASGEAYTPSVPGNWVGPAPATVQEALDRIAANTTNAHPIP